MNIPGIVLTAGLALASAGCYVVQPKEKDELARTRTERDEARDEAARLKGENEALNKDLLQARAKLSAIDRILREDNLAAFVANAPAPSIETRVLSTAWKGEDVEVHLAAGRADGVQVGQRFAIHRGGAVLGRVRIERVEDLESWGRVIFSTPRKEIREGDTARTQLD